MIPLRLKANTAGATEPFVVRLGKIPSWLGKIRGSASEECEALLVDIDGDENLYSTRNWQFSISGIEANEADGDVLLVVPRQGLAHRLVRAASTHNTFLITERCDQLCVMCSQPPKQHHTDLFQQFETAALLAPLNSTIGISGGEPTLFKKQLLAMLVAVLNERPDIHFHVLTNAQHFENDDLATLKVLSKGGVLWGIPLYSPFAFQHDEIVGKGGAFARLFQSFSVLAKAGAAIELRTVAMKPNVETLPLLANTITRRLPWISAWAIMQLENIGYGRKNWDGLFFDNSAEFSSIGRALDIAHARGIDAQLYNFPLCTVPEEYRKYAPSTISDWKRKYLGTCTECSIRSRCGGFFEWYSEARGFARVGL
jgi:His-Xaa-Ser system radical SAM maturase HxsC